MHGAAQLASRLSLIFSRVSVALSLALPRPPLSSLYPSIFPYITCIAPTLLSYVCRNVVPVCRCCSRYILYSTTDISFAGIQKAVTAATMILGKLSTNDRTVTLKLIRGQSIPVTSAIRLVDDVIPADPATHTAIPESMRVRTHVGPCRHNRWHCRC